MKNLRPKIKIGQFKQYGNVPGIRGFGDIDQVVALYFPPEEVETPGGARLTDISKATVI